MKMIRRRFLENSSVLLSASALAAAPGAAGQPQKPSRKYRLVATEEAFATQEQADFFRNAKDSVWNDPDVDLWRHFLGSEVLMRRLLDVDQERISIMDQAGVDMHVLSLTSPGVQCLDADAGTALATLANDQLAETIKRHPTRYAGLASFAPQDPARAAKEIDRAINRLKLNGLIVNSSTNNEYLDNPKFRPIFEAVTATGAALYIHPRNLPEPAAELLKADVNLWSAMWGFQVETGIHAMRLILSGVFDDFPNLKVVLGHMGEGLPYWLYRLDFMHGRVRIGFDRPKLKLTPSEYIKRNFYITTSGMNWEPTLKFCIEVLGADRIMWAIDYPYQDHEDAVEFMDAARISEKDKRKIYHENAERVFKIKRAKPGNK